MLPEFLVFFKAFSVEYNESIQGSMGSKIHKSWNFEIFGFQNDEIRIVLYQSGADYF